MAPLLEVCVDDPEGLTAAIHGGADRIELCSCLEVGGLTPAPGLMRLAASSGIPVYAMIRPRCGGFVFTKGEVEAMLGDIAAVRAAGLSGVVLGASRLDGTLDTQALGVLVAAARGIGMTLHRAFDLVPEIEPSVEQAVALGFERILTSGRARTALEGIADISRAHAAAAGRIEIMAGGGLRSVNVGSLLAAVPLREVHGSCASETEVSDGRLVELGFATAALRRHTDASEVRRFKQVLRSL